MFFYTWLTVTPDAHSIFPVQVTFGLFAKKVTVRIYPILERCTVSAKQRWGKFGQPKNISKNVFSFKTEGIRRFCVFFLIEEPELVCAISRKNSRNRFFFSCPKYVFGLHFGVYFKKWILCFFFHEFCSINYLINY